MDINRKTAYQTLLNTEKNKAYSNIELNKQIQQEQPDSPAFVRELVYGVLENRIYLDYILDRLIPKGLKGVKKQPLTLLRMGLYQIIFMDSVPEYASVNETVKIARKVIPGRERFINGVLRGYGKKKDEIALPDREKQAEEYLSVKYSFEPWIVSLWTEQYGIERAESLMKASNEKPELSVRVNRLKISTETAVKELEDAGFEVRRSEMSDRVLFVKGTGLLASESYRKGHFSVQDESSVLCAEALAPLPGQSVIDICSAPGGKTLAMAELMENRGSIKAFDIYEHKLNLLMENAQRLGISIIETGENDGEKLNEALIDTADRVLVDGPCSGLGVIRRKPEIKYKVLEDWGRELAEKQYAILKNSGRYVKSGGVLVYSTCTINKTENEDVAERFLTEHEEFELIESRQLLPDRDGCDGFFICKMRKKQ